MKTRLKIEQYVPETEYAEGRIFFGRRGTVSTVKISAYLSPLISLIKKMGIKNVIWNVTTQLPPQRLIDFLKKQGEPDEHQL